MDSQSNFLLIVLLFLSLIIWQTWEQDQKLRSQNRSQHDITGIKDDTVDYEKFNKNSKQYITIKNDVLELTVNTYGGDIERAVLLSYSKELGSNEPLSLLEITSDFIYQAQSGLSDHGNLDNLEDKFHPIYNVDKNLFILADGQNQLAVSMMFKDKDENIFTKIFILKRGEYTVDINYNIQNVGKKPIEVSMFGRLIQSVNMPSYRDIENKNFALHTFRGAAYSTLNEKYKKYDFDSIIKNQQLSTYSVGGWIAMIQQYFITAWIPKNKGINHFYTQNLNNNTVAIGYTSDTVSIPPNQIRELYSTLWIGPEIQDKMIKVAPYLDLTVDYGWLWFISQPLFRLLKFIHKFVGNWGFSIILITFIMRSIMYPLTKAQHVSIAKMRILQPKIQEIQERFRHDKNRISQEIMSLYKLKKVNPLGGCFSIFIQMPIFLALYYMLIGSIELRHAPFIFWIHDLSAQDPYYILPILMGLTMFLIQKLSTTVSDDSIHRNIMAVIPVIFTICFLWFPSGLVLYYIVSNLVTLIQQQFIYRSLEKRGLF